MTQIRNVNPIGDVDVPLLRKIVARDETVEVTDDQARALLPQFDNWEPADHSSEQILQDIHAGVPAVAADAAIVADLVAETPAVEPAPVVEVPVEAAPVADVAPVTVEGDSH